MCVGGVYVHNARSTVLGQRATRCSSCTSLFQGRVTGDTLRECTVDGDEKLTYAVVDVVENAVQ